MPFEKLLKTFTPKEISGALKSMYDAFIRDPMSGELKHEDRIKVHDVYRGIEEELED